MDHFDLMPLIGDEIAVLCEGAWMILNREAIGISFRADPVVRTSVHQLQVGECGKLVAAPQSQAHRVCADACERQGCQGYDCAKGGFHRARVLLLGRLNGDLAAARAIREHA